ncbi:hypothetical protein GPJ56_002821 [Histomonas meleagridis]|uniref:uncharacterized protein n=1 Tax=Histomonas meleagridis TaxID=135588 RepID=UPI00355A8CD0|nr:hypothetical protein GPJ56_002821 [Histomonas meleagridis]KAH0806337.1 hypothetical protein GO595_001025 [Histomonas meleagridis]
MDSNFGDFTFDLDVDMMSSPIIDRRDYYDGEINLTDVDLTCESFSYDMFDEPCLCPKKPTSIVVENSGIEIKRKIKPEKTVIKTVFKPFLSFLDTELTVKALQCQIMSRNMSHCLY